MEAVSGLYGGLKQTTASIAEVARLLGRILANPSVRLTPKCRGLFSLHPNTSSVRDLARPKPRPPAFPLVR